MATQEIIPAEKFRRPELKENLRSEDRRMLRETFLRLSQLIHAMPGQQGEDALLLLTTCRNREYTLNALYAEARKWGSEGGHHTGFGDALDRLNIATGGVKEMPAAAKRAAAVLAESATYLSEYEKKHQLFYVRFEEVHAHILNAANSIGDMISRESLIKDYCQLGNGPHPEDRLTQPSNGSDDLLERLDIWYSLARPLTGLARTYISERMGLGARHDKTYQDYLHEVEEGKRALRSFGIKSNVQPFSFKGPITTDEVAKFIDYAADSYQMCKRFLVEMIPSKMSLNERFPLELGTSKTVMIRGRSFRREEGAYTLITDMRNSTGAPYVTPELKVKVDDVIEALHGDASAGSQTTYDDCRVVVCDSLSNVIVCAARLFKALIVHKTPDGFGGLRMGLSYGEMLFADEPWENIRKAAPADNSHNTIARAARLMGFDNSRWDVQSPFGKLLQEKLGDWTTDDSLIFLDESVFNQLNEDARKECREIQVVALKGVGVHRCFGARINELVQKI